MAGETSRRNGALSRGPRTAQGKARSSINARRHGLNALLNPRRVPVHVERTGIGLARAILGHTDGLERPRASRSDDAISVDLLQATIAFAQADDAIQRIHAMKMIAQRAALATITFNRMLVDGWSDLIATCCERSCSSGIGQPLFTEDDIALLRAARDRAVADAATEDMGIAFRRGVALMPSSDLDVRSAATALCARDLEVLDRYEHRASVRRRKAMRTMRAWGARRIICTDGAVLADGDKCAGRGASSRASSGHHDRAAFAPPPLCKAVSVDPNLRVRSAARWKAGTDPKASIHTFPALGDLQLALMARYGDLDDAILMIERSALSAMDLKHHALARRHLTDEKAAMRRWQSFCEAAFTILRISSFTQVILDLREHVLATGDDSDRARMREVDAILSRVWRRPKQGPGDGQACGQGRAQNGGRDLGGDGGQDGVQRKGQHQGRDNGRKRAQGVGGFDASPSSRRRANPDCDRENKKCTNEPGGQGQGQGQGGGGRSRLRVQPQPQLQHQHQLQLELQAQPQPLALAPAQTKKVPNEPGSPPHASGSAPPRPAPMNAPSARRSDDTWPQPQAAEALHPWDGIVPPQRRGSGTMADPLIKPSIPDTIQGPGVFTEPLGSPTLTWRQVASQPAPRTGAFHGIGDAERNRQNPSAERFPDAVPSPDRNAGSERIAASQRNAGHDHPESSSPFRNDPSPTRTIQGSQSAGAKPSSSARKRRRPRRERPLYGW